MSESTNRRGALNLGIAAAIATAGSVAMTSAQAAPGSKRKKVADLAAIRPGQPVSFTYPQDEAAIAIDMGHPMPGGIGPTKSIIAYSALCQHMGCPVSYDTKSSHLVCPCHASVFDPARSGQCIEGPSTRGLPRITLKVEGATVYATGVEGGVIFGRACNNA